jgi:hypothetical protein
MVPAATTIGTQATLSAIKRMDAGIAHQYAARLPAIFTGTTFIARPLPSTRPGLRSFNSPPGKGRGN